MASVGEELKKERELRGISLIEIAEATKISPRLLRALEDDRFDIMPGDFFTRGIIRTYARYLDLDEEAILKTYFNTLNQQDLAQEELAAEEAQKEKPENKKRIFTYVGFALALIIVLIVIFTVIFRKPTPPPTSAGAGYIEDKEIPPPIFESEPAAYELNLVVRFTQRTWMQIYADNQLILEAIKQPGDEFRATAKESLRFNIGNARGYTYTINGKAGIIPLGRLGTATREALITLDNYKQFIAEEQETEDIRQKTPNVQSPFE